MGHNIEPYVQYRIRSRGVERPAVEGNRLPQMVRDFVLARHDELSADGQLWFAAGEVESLFPPPTNSRLIRKRLHPETGEQLDPMQSEMLGGDDRKAPRDPWYIARGSNVAGPYDQVRIADWYQEGCLFDDDQVRTGANAKWQSLIQAEREGLLGPPPENTCSVHPSRLMADSPIWMGPPTGGKKRSGKSVWSRQSLSKLMSAEDDRTLMIAKIIAGALVLCSIVISAVIYFTTRQQPRIQPVPASQQQRMGPLPEQMNGAAPLPTRGAAPEPANAAAPEDSSLLMPIPNQVTGMGQRIKVSFNASDPARQNDLSFELTEAPTSVKLDENVLTWVPGVRDAGRAHLLSLLVTDASGRQPPETVSFEIEVLTASLVAAEPIDAEEGQQLDTIVDLGIRSSERLRYSLSGQIPDGLSIDQASGRLNWVPGEEHSPSIVNVEIQAHNQSGHLVAAVQQNISVRERNRMIAPIETTARVGQLLTLTLRAEPRNLSDRYFISHGAPENMFLTPESGQLRWQPKQEQAPAVYEVTVALTDRLSLPSDPSLLDERTIAFKAMLDDPGRTMSIPLFSGPSETQRSGHVQVKGELLKCLLISQTPGQFGNLRELAIAVDLNGDGILHTHPGSAELFRFSETMNLNGEMYQASKPANDGSSLTLSRTSRRVDAKRYLVDGYPAPSFQAMANTGEPFDLRRACASGKYLLIEFWADTSLACQRSYQDVSDIHHEYQAAGLKMVGINLDANLERAQRAIKENQLDHVHIFDNVEKSPGIAKMYRIKTIPWNFLVDSSMQIVAVNLRGDALRAKLDQLLTN